MCAKRKDFSSAAASPIREAGSTGNAPMRFKIGSRSFDLLQWEPVAIGNGRLMATYRFGLLQDAANALWRSTYRPETKITLLASGLRNFLDYLDELYLKGVHVRNTADIDSDILSGYVSWLKGRNTLKYSAARSVYHSTKSLLAAMMEPEAVIQVFPRNPFPKHARNTEHKKPYNADEMREILRALNAQERDLKKTQSSSFEYVATLFLVFAAKTGRTLSELLNIKIGDLKPHPIKPDELAILTTIKHRAHAQHSQVQNAKGHAKTPFAVGANCAEIFREMLSVSASYRAMSAPEDREFLWLYVCRKTETAKVLRPHNIKYSISLLVKGFDLDIDGGIQVSRFRKTFAMQMWRLTGGDIYKTAHLNGNSPQVTNAHYLGVTDNMVRNHRTMIRVMQEDLTGNLRLAPDKILAFKKMGVSQDIIDSLIDGKNDTGVGKCVDPFYGKKAPQNGAPCNRWLGCFTCPDYVVMESDLYRIFSFYWLILDERNTMDRRIWEATYGRIARIIEHDIVARNTKSKTNPSGAFSDAAVRLAKLRAKRSPHPLWKTRHALALGGMNG